MSNLVVQSVLPEPAEFTMMKEMATMAVKSGLLPVAINSPEKALIIMLKGRELQIPPMQAFSHINVISGKPTMSAELMLAQIYKCVPRAVVNFTSTNEKECVIEAQRPHGMKTKFSFTIEEAQQAGLLSKGPWKQYPSAMLRARCISAMARALFPDALNGVSYTPEELGADVEIDDSGSENVKDVSPIDKKEIPEEKDPEVETSPVTPEVVTEKKPTAAELKEMSALATKRGWENSLCAEYIKVAFKKSSSKDLTLDEYNSFMRDISTMTPAEVRDVLAKAKALSEPLK